MIFNHDLVFIHIGKTGGMSCAEYLLRNLRGPVFNCHARAQQDLSRIPRDDLVAVTDVNRHCTLRGAAGHVSRIAGWDVTTMPLLLAVIRHPFTLEYSFYRQLQKPEARVRRQLTDPALVQLAESEFKRFVAGAGYHRAGLPQEGFFLLDDRAPPNLRLLRYENLESEFVAAVRPFLRDGASPRFPHRNRAAVDGAEALADLLDKETRELIYHKHRYMFDAGYYSLAWSPGDQACTTAASN